MFYKLEIGDFVCSKDNIWKLVELNYDKSLTKTYYIKEPGVWKNKFYESTPKRSFIDKSNQFIEIKLDKDEVIIKSSRLNRILYG
jgi:hypothetical protein